MQARIERLGFGPSLVIASTSGFVIALGAPPGGWLVGHWIGFVPLILMARRRAWTWRQAALLGLLGGMGVGLGGFPWIAEMLVKFARVPWLLGYLGLAFFSAWMAIPYALWAVGMRFGPLDGWRGLLFARTFGLIQCAVDELQRLAEAFGQLLALTFELLGPAGALLGLGELTLELGHPGLELGDPGLHLCHAAARPLVSLDELLDP